jgi:hypothetical protein
MFRLYSFLFVILYSANLYAEDLNNQIKFELNVMPAFSMYKDIFKKPSIAVIALQNSGATLSQTMPIEYLSFDKFKMGPADLQYIEVNRNHYYYKASLKMPFGIEKKLAIPIDLDISNLSQGKVIIIINSQIKPMIPNDLLIRLDTKIKSLASDASQKALLTYLLSEKISQNGKKLESLDERIVIDFIRQTQTATPTKDQGSSEALSDQILLIVSVLIWLAGFPLFLYVVRQKRLRLRGKK